MPAAQGFVLRWRLAVSLLVHLDFVVWGLTPLGFAVRKWAQTGLKAGVKEPGGGEGG